MRCIHEAATHKENCFITLTYDDENLPENGSLNKAHLQKFFKRLRKHLGDKQIRYYACGEYGDLTKRAHYHACLFGHNFSDRVELRRIGEHTLYYSETLTKLWGQGHTSIGELTFATAAYTARYVMKKQTGLASKGGGYAAIDGDGVITILTQPYAVMSLKPAIGKTWFQKYHRDIYNADKDYIIVKGKKLKPAKYYDQLYDKINPEHLAIIKANRYNNNEGETEQQRNTRAKIAHAKIISRKQI